MSQIKKQSLLMLVFAYFVIYVVWGSTYFFITIALESFSPFIIGSFRFLIASIVLMSYCKYKGYKLWDKKIVKQTAFIGLLLLFVDMAAVIWVEQFISSGIVAIMSAAAAIWFVIFDRPKWKQNFSSIPTLLGLVLGFIGVILLFAEQLNIATDTASMWQSVIGLLILIVGSISWTVGSLYTKYVVEKEEKKEDLHILVKTAWQMISAGFVFNLVAFLTGEYAQFSIQEVSMHGWLALVYLTTFGSILAFTCYLWLIQHRPATEVSTYAYVNPIVAVVLTYFFTDDIITSLQIIGLVVILVSVVMMNWNLYRNSKKNKGKIISEQYKSKCTK